MKRWIAILIVLLAGKTFAAEEGKFADLGAQITSTTLQGTTFTKDPSGHDVVCTVIRGEPAKLLVFDVRSGELLHRLPLEGAKGAWNATTATDGSVYVGTDDNGHLYRWIPGEQAVADLGQVAPDQTFVWDETAGDDGEVFVSTYPGCQVIRYRPGETSRDVAKGPAAPGENYGRSIAYDPGGEKIYVGVGAHAKLIEVDPKTATRQNILPPEYAGKKFVYSVRMTGGRLFALLTDGGQCLVIDPATEKVESVLFDVPPQLVISGKSPYDDKVYFKGQNKLCWYDLKTHRSEPTEISSAGGIIGMKWLQLGEPDSPDQTLVMLTPRGNLIRYHPPTGKSSTTRLKAPPEETPIQSIARGPDGRIYCGGYLSGGLSTYDPKTEKHEQYAGISQSESMGVLGNRLFCGIYPHARLWAYDVTQPWNPAGDNPQKLDQLDRVGQDRPMATLGVEELKKVFFGTIPDYGTLGGTVSVYDAASGKVDVFKNVVQDQSVISLAYAGGLIVGGTSRSGGLGIEPKAAEAKLFGWDPKANKKVFEIAPVEGAWLITGLVVGPDKNVWGVADETLFVFDMNKRQVVFTKHLFTSVENTRHAHWRDAFTTMHPDGSIYGTMGGKLFKLDPSTKEITVLREDGSVLLALDDAGRLYFRSARTHLWQYVPAQAAANFRR